MSSLRSYSTTAADRPQFPITDDMTNPITGKSFSPNELHQLKLTSLKPVSPWFSITLVGDSKTSCTRPDYIKYVGDQPLIYIYRLKEDPAISYIGSAERGSKRFTTHREHCSAYLRDVKRIRLGSKGLYGAVQKHGWNAFEVAVLTFVPNKESLPLYENAYLALKPLLNRSYFRDDKVQIKPEIVAEVSKRMSGMNNPFYGKTHSPEQRKIMSLSHTNRISVYKYSVDYEYTGQHADSLNGAVRLGAKYTGVQRVSASGGTHRGFRYSNLPPVLDRATGKMVMPLEGRVLDPLKGTGSSQFKPMKVTRRDSDITQYFVGLRRAVTVIQSGELWPGHSVTRQSVAYTMRKVDSAIGKSFESKGFIFTYVTKDEFMEWYNDAEQENRLLSFAPWRVHTEKK